MGMTKTLAPHSETPDPIPDPRNATPTMTQP